MTRTQPTASNLRARATWAIVGGLLVAVTWFGFRAIQRQQQFVLYEICTDKLNQDAALRKAIGSPINYDSSELAVPDMETMRVNQKANVKFKMHGSTGHATIQAQLLYKNGHWSVQRFAAECDNGTYIEEPESGLL